MNVTIECAQGLAAASVAGCLLPALARSLAFDLPHLDVIDSAALTTRRVVNPYSPSSSRFKEGAPFPWAAGLCRLTVPKRVRSCPSALRKARIATSCDFPGRGTFITPPSCEYLRDSRTSLRVNASFPHQISHVFLDSCRVYISFGQTGPKQSRALRRINTAQKVDGLRFEQFSLEILHRPLVPSNSGLKCRPDSRDI